MTAATSWFPDNVGIYFRDSETSCTMYLFDMIKFDPADRAELLDVVNGQRS